MHTSSVILWTSLLAFSVIVIVALITLMCLRAKTRLLSRLLIALRMATFMVPPSPLPLWYILGDASSGNAASINAIFTAFMSILQSKQSITKLLFCQRFGFLHFLRTHRITPCPRVIVAEDNQRRLASALDNGVYEALVLFAVAGLFIESPIRCHIDFLASSAAHF